MRSSLYTLCPAHHLHSAVRRAGQDSRAAGGRTHNAGGVPLRMLVRSLSGHRHFGHIQQARHAITRSRQQPVARKKKTD